MQELEKKARGAYFTPLKVASFITNWAVRERSDRVLEPSCGEAAFLTSIADRLKSLKAGPSEIKGQIEGLDIHAESVMTAQLLLCTEGHEAKLEVGDFFEREPQPLFDAVVGNPPYVRYQEFNGPMRAAALQAALRQGVRLTQLASSWAAFTVHASAFLRPGGRLGLVLPAELLSVSYASEIRKFLLKRFRSVRLVLFEDLIFPGVLEDVVLLLAEGHGGAASFEVYQAKDAEDLVTRTPEHWTQFTPQGEDKWTSALLDEDAHALNDAVLCSESFEQLQEWGSPYLGAVTGNNKYFTLTKSQATALKLSSSELVRISPPGSRHLRGLNFSDAAWNSLAEANAPCYLFAPSKNPSKAALSYIAEGERTNVHKAYKCEVRTPWWRVPLVARPDLLFTYMNHDRPRLVRNSAGAHLLNSLYGIKLGEKRRELGQELLPLAALNSVTLLGAEMVGRAYGGGLLKHEPTEARRLPVPSFKALTAMAESLRCVQSQVAALMRTSDIGPAIDVVDGIVLRDFQGLSEAQLATIRRARETLMVRRTGRTKGE